MKITLSYQPQQLIPPFAYAAVMDIHLDNEQVHLEFNLEYLGRDSVSDEELQAEGFTRDDDFKWTGTINSRWLVDIESLPQMTTTNEPDNDAYLHVAVDGKEIGYPKDIKTAEIIYQELMQAILEQAAIEAPLIVGCCINKKTYDLMWDFSKRSIEINGKVSFNWEAGRALLETIYRVDFESVRPQKKSAINAIMPGDGLWYSVKSEEMIQAINNRLNDVIVENRI